MLKEIWNSFKEAIHNRVSSPIYGIFLISRSITNRRFWYITFFIDQSVIQNIHKLDKVAYLEKIYSSYGIYRNWADLLLIPLIGSIGYIRLMPYFDRLVLEKVSSSELLKYDIKLKYSNIRKEKIKEENKVLQETVSQKDKNKELTNFIDDDSDESIWQKEYEKLKNKQLSIHLKRLSNIIYMGKGMAYGDNKDSLEFLDLNGLITLAPIRRGIDDDYSATLTKKGKYFLKLYNS